MSRLLLNRKFEFAALLGALLALASLFLDPIYWVIGTLVSVLFTSGALLKRRESWFVRCCTAAVPAFIVIRVLLSPSP